MYVDSERIARASLAVLALVIGIGFTPDAIGQHHHGRRRAQTTTQTRTCRGHDARQAQRDRVAGIEAYDAGDYRTCVVRLRASMMTPECATQEAHLNLGICLDADGHPQEALGELEIVQRDQTLPPNDRRRLEERISHVRERLAPAQTPVEPPVQTPTATCTVGLTECYGTCRDLMTDASDCGACGTVCPLGQTCQRGACQPPVVQRVVDVRQPPPPRQTPTTSPPSRAGGVALITSGATAAITGGVVLALGLINQGQESADMERLAMDGCSVASNSPTCVRYREGATLPGDLAAWQIPVGAATLGVGIAATVVGIVLVARHPDQPPPRAQPTASLTLGGLTLGLSGTF